MVRLVDKSQHLPFYFNAKQGRTTLNEVVGLIKRQSETPFGKWYTFLKNLPLELHPWKPQFDIASSAGWNYVNLILGHDCDEVEVQVLANDFHRESADPKDCQHAFLAIKFKKGDETVGLRIVVVNTEGEIKDIINHGLLNSNTGGINWSSIAHQLRTYQ